MDKKPTHKQIYWALRKRIVIQIAKFDIGV